MVVTPAAVGDPIRVDTDANRRDDPDIGTLARTPISIIIVAERLAPLAAGIRADRGIRITGILGGQSEPFNLS